MQLNHCAVCGSEDLRDWFGTGFGSIGKCAGCGQVLRTDHPTVEGMVGAHQAGKLHESAYATHSEAAADDLPFLPDFFQRAMAAAPLRRVLDIGCSTGHGLTQFEALGFEAVGIEPVRELRDVARARLKGTVLPSAIEDVELEPASFGVVVLWDSIEHLVDPGTVLAKAYEWLAPGGLLGVATLNHDSHMYSIFHALRRVLPSLAAPFGERLYNPFHTYYFTLRSLASLVERAGFHIDVHRGYEFPLSRLDAGATLKTGMRGLYAVQRLTGSEGEQYLFAHKPAVPTPAMRSCGPTTRAHCNG